MTTAPTVPLITAGGASIPQVGFGTYKLSPDVLDFAVPAAIAAGYRHFDTAKFYGNEAALGSALRGSGLARDDFFVTTKVWRDELGADALRRSAEESVERIGIGPVDLLLIHWPNDAVALSETIDALCVTKRGGLTRHIGVSNFTPSLVAQTLEITSEPIVTNQCECHPYFIQSELKSFCEARGIAFTAYSPIGSGQLISDPAIGRIATAHGKSAAQIMLRWHLQRGNIVVPRSSNPSRIAENIDIFDFNLSEADIAAINALHSDDGRMMSPSWVRSWS